MKTIAIVATGGTIAGTGKKGKTAAYHAGEIDIDFIENSLHKSQQKLLNDLADGKMIQ